jgi:glutamyl-tRNA reductase
MHKKTQHCQSFWVVGINYKKTDACVRGLFAVNPSQYDYLLSIAPDYGLKELFIVSTCNRTEVYGVADNAQQLIDLLCNVTTGDAATFASMAYIKNGASAIGHLYHVAAGLDSQILGDYEILGQIKSAVKQSKSKGFIGAFTERLVNSVLQSSKSVKTNTELSGGTVSVSFAAIQYIKQNTASVKDKKIVLVGMGKIGKSTCRNLVHYLDTHNITLINRTEETAVALAEELSLRSVAITNLSEEVAAADIIIVSTNAPEPIILKSHLMGNGNKLVIDLSVPCNVAHDATVLEGVTVVNVDTLSKINDDTLEMRKTQVPQAIEIINHHIAELREWYDMRRHVPILKEVKEKLSGMHIDASLLNSIHAQPNPVNKEQTIQSVINVLATKMRKNNTAGCNYIEAINDFIAHHV